MSGTGERAEAVERHLGDRLAALIDGELSHEVRERVLAHLATCGDCRVEADAQRRVKSVCADTAPPPPPAGLLARLQGLPAAAGVWSDEDGGRPSRGAARTTHATPLGLGLPSEGLLRHSGFRIHVPGRGGSRGRRFAFAAAAGAFSVAALAFGVAVNGGSVADDTTAAPAERSGPTTGPVSPRENAHEAVDDAERQPVLARDRSPAGAVSGGPVTGQAPAQGVLALRTESFVPLFGQLVPLTSPLLVPTPSTTAPAPGSVTPGSPSPTPLPSAAPDGSRGMRGTPPSASETSAAGRGG